jgi:hypothetical protein
MDLLKDFVVHSKICTLIIAYHRETKLEQKRPWRGDLINIAHNYDLSTRILLQAVLHVLLVL